MNMKPSGKTLTAGGKKYRSVRAAVQLIARRPSPPGPIAAAFVHFHRFGAST